MDNTQAWLDWAQQPYDQGGLGLQPHQAAGVVGNLLHESGPGLPAWGPSGDNGTAWGTAQWRGDRLTGLKQFAAQNGMDHRDPRAQMAWMRNELTGPYSGAYDALKAAKTPEEAATAFNRRYEISADNTGGREATAAALANGSDPVAAVNKIAGVQPRSANTGGALAFNGDPADNAEDTSDDNSGALSKAAGDGALFKGEGKNKLHSIGAMMTNIAAALASINNPAQAQALQKQAEGIEARSGSRYQYQMGANGQLVRINKDTGDVDSREIPGASKGNFQVILSKTTGLPIGRVDKDTGEYKPYSGQSGQPQNSMFGAPVTEDNPHGLPDDIEVLRSSGKAGQSLANQVDQVYRGDIAYPTTGGQRNPQAQQLRDALGIYHPDMNANDFNARKKFRESVADAKGNGRGAQYASLNHFYDLASQAADNVERIGNSDNFLPVGMQQVYNSAKNQQNTQDRSGAAKNIDNSLVPSMMGETSKLYYGTQGGGQEERRIISGSLKSNDTLTNQIEGLKTLRDMAVARQHVLEGEADKSYGKGAEQFYPVDKAGQASLDKLNATIARLEAKRDGTAAPAAAKPAAPAAIPSSWADAQKAGWK